MIVELDRYRGCVEVRHVVHVEDGVDLTLEIIVWGRLLYREPQDLHMWLGSNVAARWPWLEEVRLHAW